MSVFKDVLFEGLSEFRLFVNSNFSEPVQLGFNVSVGESIARFESTPEVGNSVDMSVFATLRPGQHLSISPQFVYSQLVDKETGEEFFSGFIVRSRVKYQFFAQVFLADDCSVQ